MRISNKSIRNLRELIRLEYGIALTDEDAQSVGLDIVRYVYARELVIQSNAVHNKTQGL